MSKYIIELPDNVKKLVYFHVGNANATWITTNDLDDLEELDSDYINEHFGELQDEAYQRGLEDAWEAARKIVVDPDNGGIASETLLEIFGMRGYSYIMQENTAQEAIDKIKAYEEQADRIEVGDEVESPHGKAVVTAVKDDFVHYFYSDGDCRFTEQENLKKTGKHYDIQSILREMQND